jgi:hypothetical protein
MTDNSLAKLKTMDCDVIRKSLYTAMGHLCDADLELMADVLFEIVEPIASERAFLDVAGTITKAPAGAHARSV